MKKILRSTFNIKSHGVNIVRRHSTATVTTSGQDSNIFQDFGAPQLYLNLNPLPVISSVANSPSPLHQQWGGAPSA